jgi:hypothetical protein
MADSLYRVTFSDPVTRQMVTLRLHEISDSGLGPLFVRLGRFVFDQDSGIINPINEQLAKRYEETKALHVNRMAISQIEELSGAEEVKLSEVPNVVPFTPPDA